MIGCELYPQHRRLMSCGTSRSTMKTKMRREKMNLDQIQICNSTWMSRINMPEACVSTLVDGYCSVTSEQSTISHGGFCSDLNKSTFKKHEPPIFKYMYLWKTLNSWELIILHRIVTLLVSFESVFLLHPDHPELCSSSDENLREIAGKSSGRDDHVLQSIHLYL